MFEDSSLPSRGAVLSALHLGDLGPACAHKGRLPRVSGPSFVRGPVTRLELIFGERVRSDSKSLLLLVLHVDIPVSPQTSESVSRPFVLSSCSAGVALHRYQSFFIVTFILC